LPKSPPRSKHKGKGDHVGLHLLEPARIGGFIPGAEQISALKEVGANIGGSVGTSFTFASSAKDQIISEAAREVMQGASQLLQKKLRTIKVTIKGGYKLYLMPSK